MSGTAKISLTAEERQVLKKTVVFFKDPDRWSCKSTACTDDYQIVELFNADATRFDPIGGMALHVLPTPNADNSEHALTQANELAEKIMPGVDIVRYARKAGRAKFVRKLERILSENH